MNPYIKNILRFCIIVLLQVLILDQISLKWWSEPSNFPVFIPFIYPLFILLLPVEVPVWGLLIAGFLTGLTVDSFMSTAGMHACAAVFIAYLRTNVLSALLPRNLSEYTGQEPNIKTMGWGPFLVYSGFLLLLHNAIFFSVQLWNVSNMGYLLLKIAVATLTSMLFVIAYILLFTRPSNTRI